MQKSSETSMTTRNCWRRTMYSLTIPGDPVAKARPRVGKYGTFTPQKTKNYETLVKELYFTKYGQTLMEGELKIDLKAFFSIPKSTSKKKRAEMQDGRIRPTKKPDIDNIIKSVTDALNGVAYVDDSQVVEIVAHKHYSDVPRVEIHISNL